jgi:hypothetical protein
MVDKGRGDSIGFTGFTCEEPQDTKAKKKDTTIKRIKLFHSLKQIAFPFKNVPRIKCTRREVISQSTATVIPIAINRADNIASSF